jgi:hypothetical protein
MNFDRLKINMGTFQYMKETFLPGHSTPKQFAIAENSASGFQSLLGQLHRHIPSSTAASCPPQTSNEETTGAQLYFSMARE